MCVTIILEQALPVFEEFVFSLAVLLAYISEVSLKSSLIGNIVCTVWPNSAWLSLLAEYSD